MVEAHRLTAYGADVSAFVGRVLGREGALHESRVLQAKRFRNTSMGGMMGQL